MANHETPRPSRPSRPSRRQFLKGALAAGAAVGFPAIVPSTVFGQNAPSNRIHLAQIGCGRIARSWDFPNLLKHHALARYVALCDLDSIRIQDAKAQIEGYYAKTLGQGKFSALRTYGDYRELLKSRDIDAVVICTPDHWHAQPAIEAALAGKDVYVQKPMSLTIREGRQMADTIKRTGRIFQVGSQLRSAEHFRLACELVRNGRIGKLKEIQLGLPIDPAGGNPTPMPVPANLNYDAWLGSTPQVPYTIDRVHPQSPDVRKRYDRPGWLRCEQFGAGMITGWGAHDIDIAHWGMGMDLGGPIEIEASAQFPSEGLWNVHGPFRVEAKYANGVILRIDDKHPSGVKFIGEDGWVWVTRGTYVATASDPKTNARNAKALDASDPKIIKAGIRPGELHLHASPGNDHHLDFLTAIRTRQEPAAPAEVAHRSCSACLIAHAAMKLGRKLAWDPEHEHFVNDAEADAMLRRPQRAPYGTDAVLARLG